MTTYSFASPVNSRVRTRETQFGEVLCEFLSSAAFQSLQNSDLFAH